MFKFSLFAAASLLALNLHPVLASNNNNNEPYEPRIVKHISTDHNAPLVSLESAPGDSKALITVITADHQINEFLEHNLRFINSPDFFDHFHRRFESGLTFYSEFKDRFSERRKDPAYCIGLLQSYILEWRAISGVCNRYFEQVKACHDRILDNKKVLEYLTENDISFPAQRCHLISLIDQLSATGVSNISLGIALEKSDSILEKGSKVRMALGELSSRLDATRDEQSDPLKSGVEAFRRFLKEDNDKLFDAIKPLIVKYKTFSKRLEDIARELNQDSVHDLMLRATISLTHQIDELVSHSKKIEAQHESKLTYIHETLRWLKDRVDTRKSRSPILKVFYAACAQEWHGYFGGQRFSVFKPEVIRWFEMAEAKDDAAINYEDLKQLNEHDLFNFYRDKCISELFRLYENQEVIGYLQSIQSDDRNAAIMLGSMNQSLIALEEWRQLHRKTKTSAASQSLVSQEKAFIEGVQTLSESQDKGLSYLHQKATEHANALDMMLADQSREQLWQAYKDLKSNGRTQAIVQILNNLVEENVKGFKSEDFIRWTLVRFFIPNLVDKLPDILDGLIVAIAKKLDVDPQQPLEQALAMRNASQPDREVIRKFKAHFPEVRELQTAKGIVGDDLIRIIKNLPIEFFAQTVGGSVVKLLNARDALMQNMIREYSELVTEQVCSEFQRLLVKAVREHFQAPSLMTLNDPQLEVLLKDREDAEDKGLLTTLSKLKEREQQLVRQVRVYGLSIPSKESGRWDSLLALSVKGAHGALSIGTAPLSTLKQAGSRFGEWLDKKACDCLINWLGIDEEEETVAPLDLRNRFLALIKDLEKFRNEDLNDNIPEDFELI